jgi:hypothetical protein
MEEKQKSLSRYPCQSNKAPAASARQNNDPRAAVATGTFVPPAMMSSERVKHRNLDLRTKVASDFPRYVGLHSEAKLW